MDLAAVEVVLEEGEEEVMTTARLTTVATAVGDEDEVEEVTEEGLRTGRITEEEEGVTTGSEVGRLVDEGSTSTRAEEAEAGTGGIGRLDGASTGVGRTTGLRGVGMTRLVITREDTTIEVEVCKPSSSILLDLGEEGM